MPLNLELTVAAGLEARGWWRRPPAARGRGGGGGLRPPAAAGAQSHVAVGARVCSLPYSDTVHTRSSSDSALVPTRLTELPRTCAFLESHGGSTRTRYRVRIRAEVWSLDDHDVALAMYIYLYLHAAPTQMIQRL